MAVRRRWNKSNEACVLSSLGEIFQTDTPSRVLNRRTSPRGPLPKSSVGMLFRADIHRLLSQSDFGGDRKCSEYVRRARQTPSSPTERSSLSFGSLDLADMCQKRQQVENFLPVKGIE